MNSLLKIRASIINFYGSADMYLVPILKFFLAFLLFYGINRYYGYMESLNKIFIVIVLAVVCAVLPLGATVAIGMILIVLHCFGIGTEIGVFAACLFLLMYILIIRFVPKDSLAILLTPFAFVFRVPAAIPVSLGMVGKATSALTGILGVIAFFFLRQLPEIARFKEAEDPTMLEVLKTAVDSIAKNTEMIIYAIVFAAVILVVFLVRKFCTTYGWLISVLVGTAAYIILLVCGASFLEISIDLTWHIAGSLISAGIALVIAFFLFNADYKGSRYLQFEDDDYYYYVKAIPKTKVIAEPDEEEEEEEIYFKNEDIKEYQDKTGQIDFRQVRKEARQDGMDDTKVIEPEKK